jgi:hypothetical protein
VLIHSPPARVWRLIEKHLEHPEVSPIDLDPWSSIREVRGEPLSKQRTGVGASTRWFYMYGKRPFSWDDIVTEWEPEHRVAWKATSAWSMVDSFTLALRDDGTVLAYDMRYSLRYGPLGLAYGKLLLESKMRRNLLGVLQRMKRLSESPLSPEKRD